MAGGEDVDAVPNASTTENLGPFAYQTLAFHRALVRIAYGDVWPFAQIARAVTALQKSHLTFT